MDVGAAAAHGCCRLPIVRRCCCLPPRQPWCCDGACQSAGIFSVSATADVLQRSLYAMPTWSGLLPPRPFKQFLETGTLAALTEAGVTGGDGGGGAPVDKAGEVGLKFL